MRLFACRFFIVLLALVWAGGASANPHVVVDVRSGAVLSQEQPFKRWQPASLTKLMTAYIAFREVRSGKLSMKSPVKVTSNAAKEPPSKMGYKVGTIITLDNALKMLIVKSANDIAVAIGEAISGTEPAFIERMNAEAARLGMSDTNFANPNGLPDSTQYSTARDLAVLAAAIRREFPEYDPLFAIEAINAGGNILRTYNILIGRYPGADGMKTGYVCASGFNLVGSATRDGRTLAVVVLGALSQTERADKAANLLTEAFAAPVPANAPTLASLKPQGEASTAVADISGDICTAEARANRYDGRDVDGQLVFRAADLTPMNRAPVAVRVTVGGATGPAAANTDYADVPIPTPRPDYSANDNKETAGEAPAAIAEMRGTLAPGVPIPEPRPEDAVQ